MEEKLNDRDNQPVDKKSPQPDNQDNQKEENASADTNAAREREKEEADKKKLSMSFPPGKKLAEVDEKEEDKPSHKDQARDKGPSQNQRLDEK